MSRLSSQSSQETLFERRKAIRALLQNPLISARSPLHQEFIVIRRHAEWLRSWFARNPGWYLQVSREVARLRKTPAFPVDSTKPAREPKSRMAFTRRRYVLFCLALAALEKAERQTVLNRLAQEIAHLLSSEPKFATEGIGFDMSRFEDRRDLVHVVRLLLDLQVLSRVQGDEDHYLKNEQKDVLYSVNRAELGLVLNCQQGPSIVDEHDPDGRLHAITDTPLPDSEDGRNRRIRSHLNRRLVDEPILYYRELDPRQLAYLTSQRPHILRELEEGTGLIPEIRREGLALIDEEDMLTDIRMPDQGTDGHFSLLIAEYLGDRAHIQDEAGVLYSELLAYSRDLIKEHRSRSLWRKDVEQDGADHALLQQALERLEALRLIQIDESNPRRIHPWPALARFSVGEPRTQGSAGGDEDFIS